MPVATVPGMELYVGLLREQVNVYPLGAVGDTPPTRTLNGPSTQLDGVGGVALDNDRYLYVGNAATSTITVYPPDASGDTPPVRVIQGDATRLGVPDGVALDSAGNLYVLNTGGVPQNRTITVYAPGANGNAAPIRVIGGIEVESGNLNGIAIDALDYLYVAEDLPGTISVYAPGAGGNPAPVRRITGPNTTLSTVSALDFDAAGYLYVANGNSVVVFDSGADGNATPVRIIAGNHTGISEDFALAVDPAGLVYVGNAQPTLVNGHVNVFAPGANGNVAPIRVITSFSAGVPVVGMAVDKPRTPPKHRHVPQIAELVAWLLGGVTVDGGGIAIVGGVPIPVGPWGPMTADNASRQDLVVSMAIERMATHLGDTDRAGAIRAASLELMKAKINEMMANLP
jgi:hypothetical protein